MEFLIGRLLEDGIVNLELVDEAKAALAEFSKDYNEVLTDEPDAALGNGGLGRLAPSPELRDPRQRLLLEFNEKESF